MAHSHTFQLLKDTSTWPQKFPAAVPAARMSSIWNGTARIAAPKLRQMLAQPARAGNRNSLARSAVDAAQRIAAQRRSRESISAPQVRHKES